MFARGEAICITRMRHRCHVVYLSVDITSFNAQAPEKLVRFRLADRRYHSFRKNAKCPETPPGRQPFQGWVLPAYPPCPSTT